MIHEKINLKISKMPRKKTVARKSVKKVFKNCPICNQKMDLYVTSHRSTPFVDNNNYPKMCFGCYNVPRTQRQKYNEEGYIIEDAILEYSMKNLNTAKDLFHQGSTDSMEEARICVRSVKNLKLGKNVKNKKKPKLEVKLADDD